MNKEFQKEIEVEMSFDGVVLQGSSFIRVKDGVVDFSQAEQHFYDIMRKWEKDWIKEAHDEERDFIMNNLTQEQEDKLQTKHAENYIGTDDDMPDDLVDWIGELDLDELKAITK